MTESFILQTGAYEARMKREALTLTARIESRRGVVFDTMRPLNIAFVEIAYDGEGDEGQVSDETDPRQLFNRECNAARN